MSVLLSQFVPSSPSPAVSTSPFFTRLIYFSRLIYMCSYTMLGFLSDFTPYKVKVKSLSCVRLFATPWTVACQAPPSMGFSQHKYWSGLPFPSPWDLPDPRIEPRSPALQADSLPSEPPRKPVISIHSIYKAVSSSTDERTKMWYIYTMEYYSAIKRNEFESVPWAFDSSAPYASFQSIHFPPFPLLILSPAQATPVTSVTIGRQELHLTF